MAENVAGEPPGKAGEWVTVAEAARRLGITPKAVRERIRHDSILWKPNGNVGRLVLVTEPSREPPGEAEDAVGEELAELRDALSEERVARARAEGELAAERRHSAGLKALLTETRDIAERREAEHKAVVAELRAELAEARKPALVRLIEALRRR